jgi:YYY domain-containing protein
MEDTMLAVLSWWLIMEVIGLLALPIALRLFRNLPERGYAFARPLGLLLTGYALWMGASLGILGNSRTAILFILVLLGLASAAIWRREGEDMLGFLRRNQRLIIATELIFALALFGWAAVRAYNPEISATEKPMEIAFLNAILRSERFPPPDPWLSGFAISYYYFGYLMMAILTKLSGVAASVAFNLAISLLFALTATGSFSIAYNLLATDQGKRVKEGISNILWALLGPLFVVVVGNLEGVFEVLHTRGLGSPAFWKWLDIEGQAAAPVNGRWVPTDSWWWWRASRVVNDRDLYGNHMEVIDEFPQFSFLLGDMHPHVLALPFVLLALALSLNLLLGAKGWLKQTGDSRQQTADRRKGRAGSRKLGSGTSEGGAPQSGILATARHWLLTTRYSFLGLWSAHAFDIVMLALCLGALGFLNTWDLPIHFVVAIGAFLIGQRLGGNEQWLASTVLFALAIAVPAIVLYLPFYLGFQSQAGGVLPVLFNVTRLHQYLLMYGLFIFVIVSVIVRQMARSVAGLSSEERRHLPLDLLTRLLWLVAGPLFLLLTSILLVLVTSAGKQFLQGLLADERVKALVGDRGVLGLLRQAVLMRLNNPWMFLLVAVVVVALWYLVERSWQGRLPQASIPRSGWGQPEGEEAEPAPLFAYLIAGVAFLLTLAVEFVYLRDSFGTRMNTVFKFYYQAWVMMGLAAAFGCYYLLGRQQPVKAPGPQLARGAWAMVLVVLVLIGLVYPVLGIPSKAGDFRGQPTLDGMAFIKNVRADDYAAMKWLQANVSGQPHIVESTGGSYTETAWVSAFTGLPTLLGWDFHEYQWRGNSTEANTRRPDILQIYQNTDPQQVLRLLDKYDVEYVYLGPVEQDKFALQPTTGERLSRFLEKVYEGGSVSIYRR